MAAEGTINVVARDLKSPRDLCLHLKDFGLPAEKGEVERIRNAARNFAGPSPVTPDGAFSDVGLEDFVGTCGGS